MSEYVKMNDTLIYNYQKDIIDDKDKQIEDLQHQLQQKENIIKEVREYVIQEMNNIDAITYINILEILDKADKGE